MTRFLPILAILLFAVSAQAETTVPGSKAEISLSFAPVVRQAAPAVVNIYAKRVVATRVSPFADDPFFRELFRGQGRTVPRVQNSLGSGVILSSDGIVVSNYHVVGQATEIRVVLNDRREFDATVLLGDEEADLAILQLNDARDLPTLELRDSDDVEVGDLVLAIGNPFGIGQTVSSGIVSGLARSGVSVGSGRGYFIQTDAAINPGNSGGALVDGRGRLVGINTAILTRSGGSNGIGFAIPANLVQRFVEQAAAGSSQFARPWAGIGGQAVDAALAEGLGMGLPVGVVVSELHAESPFREAGLKVGDVILTLDGTPVNTPQEMIFRMASRGIGDTLSMTYLRRGVEVEGQVALVLPPETPARAQVVISERSVLSGMTVLNINPAVASEFGLGVTSQGVIVSDPGTVGARVGLRAGDILLRVNKTTIKDTDDVATAAENAGRSWLIEYIRGGQRGVLRFRV
ncbi:trypsin-like peptidase domain-containing protein [Actibacterium lipolyticum]|uniref:Periplasmic serine endoprotease DegP n=1 Tax=Actibacterium lipolyticum TaxID=1524263 RepID=A0A238JJZ7_9RHOB|nr:trypsin-like peptidase domain-containing protein [Actibacterium lipolyticum]SMX30979.1 Periplasmic serine endoprotease DegP precursor [Actibacterium lipolyticum]